MLAVSDDHADVVKVLMDEFEFDATRRDMVYVCTVHSHFPKLSDKNY